MTTTTAEAPKAPTASDSPAAFSPAIPLQEKKETPFNINASPLLQVVIATADVDFHIRMPGMPGGFIRYRKGERVKLWLAASKEYPQVYCARAADGAGEGTLRLDRIKPAGLPFFVRLGAG